MKTLKTVLVATVAIACSPLVLADAEKDCLLKGTVVHGEQAGQDTMVQIHSVKRYDEDSRCKVRRDQKMEFRLPQDSRLKNAPSGSEVQYRYRSDGSGNSDTELLSIGA
ncbi:MAG: hypothetical protein CME59_12815 [Halioglobus sp.]|nr:hypothetical protein [Halioglobus sp.]|tara:strand:- start:2141 stop:2467 length:327 start_codon:yes stop_codon:yes gene_type:complete